MSCPVVFSPSESQARDMEHAFWENHPSSTALVGADHQEELRAIVSMRQRVVESNFDMRTNVHVP